MPPPSFCNQVNTQSAHDQGNVNDFENCRSEISIPEQDCKSGLRSDTVGIVKSLLGPSLEDAVLRTLEFGRSLMQKPESLDTEDNCRDKKVVTKLPKEITDCKNKELNVEVLLEERSKSPFRRNKNKSNEKERLLALTGKLDKDELSQKLNSSKKLSGVSKIRSLDSDLKQCPPSPEKIKKQLEALIQINKDEPLERSWNFISPKTPSIPVDMTVMPSLCVYKNETEMNYSSSCDVQSQVSRAADCSETTSRMRSCQKKRHPNKICQAPEFISNALGPTIDVSIIDNLKMMRDIFKYDRCGKGEGSVKEPSMKQEIRLQNSEAEMTCRIDELQKKIEELEQKEQCLIKQIEEEERERECKRRAFEEEENRLSGMRVCMETLTEGKRTKDTTRSMVNCNYDSKYETLMLRIANEEEKLSRLKCQHDQYKRELAEAKCRKETLKKNKCLLDAWDVFASRVCHTRLPSFSRAYELERKEFKNDDVNSHCCLPSVTTPEACCKKTSSRSDHDVCREHGSQANIRCKIKMGEVQFPIQREIVCGLHQMLKTCCCSSKTGMKTSLQMASSEDDLRKKQRGHENCHPNHCKNMSFDSSAEIINRHAAGDKRACRSKSDTSLKHDKCSKIVKVLWAVTRINIFQNNTRTYEIMDATSTPPACPPAKTEGIFVVKSPQQKCCMSTLKSKGSPFLK